MAVGGTGVAFAVRVMRRTGLEMTTLSIPKRTTSWGSPFLMVTATEASVVSLCSAGRVSGSMVTL